MGHGGGLVTEGARHGRRREVKLRRRASWLPEGKTVHTIVEVKSRRHLFPETSTWMTAGPAATVAAALE